MRSVGLVLETKTEKKPITNRIGPAGGRDYFVRSDNFFELMRRMRYLLEELSQGTIRVGCERQAADDIARFFSSALDDPKIMVCIKIEPIQKSVRIRFLLGGEEVSLVALEN